MSQGEREQASRIVRGIWEGGIRSASFEDPRTPEFAKAALSELVALLEKGVPGLLQEALEGADLSANQLAVDDTHGLMELVQNADDQRASRLRFGLRRTSSRRELLAAHDGDPITVSDIVAMCVAFVSTKRNDPGMTGKFGIGLKTLSRLADRFEVHCSPYHFEIAGSKLRMISRPRRTKFHDPKSTDTLFVLPLREEELSPRIRQWVDSRSAGDLVFLTHLRELSWIHLPSGKVGTARRLAERKTDKTIIWRRMGRALSIRKTELRDRAVGLDWIRYDAEVPVPKKLKRAFKATGDTTTVSVAVPSKAKANVLYAGLPTKISLVLPYAIGAAFDPNTARTQIQQSQWNEWLWKVVSGLVTNLALSLLEEEPGTAWRMIPASDETQVPIDPWVEERIEALASATWKGIHYRGQISIDGRLTKLQQISYECEALDDILASDDFAMLAPKHARLPDQARDTDRRWRTILEELDIGKRLEVDDALNLLPFCVDRPLDRAPEWYVRLVCAALDADLDSRLETLPCVLVDDPMKLVPPDSGGFSIDDEIAPLAARLGLVHALHDSLLGEDGGQERIRSWLEQLGRLWRQLDATAILEAIAGRSPDERLELSDDNLVELRDLIDEVDELEPSLLLRVGQAIAIEAYHWVDDEQVFEKGVVGSLYLPAAIEGERDGWPKVASRTPGLKWAVPRYANLLNPGDRRSGKSGARRFLGRLGASNVFRLVNQPYREVGNRSLPTLQSQALDEFLRQNREFDEHQDRRGLREDYDSPDLESVIMDICDSPKKERLDRGLALIRVLDRNWRRSLHQKSFCTATYFYYTSNDLGDVSASWIAKLADAPWLYNEKGLPAKPIELTIRYPLTQALFGDAKERFAAGVQDDLAPGLADALGFEERPKASTVVAALTQLRSSGGVTRWEEVRSYYAYLADLCSSSTDPIDPKGTVDDIGVAQLRGKFGINPKGRGLVFIEGAWRTPTAVLRGRPIFGARRPFVPVGRYEHLWNTLGIREPNVRDCIAILEEVASNGDAVSEEGVLAETFRHLTSLLESATAADRRKLASVPLWSGSCWVTRRPIYYLTDENAAQSLGGTHDVWRPPCPLEGMASLVEALGVTFIPSENCVPTGIETRLRVEPSLRDEYSSAVEALKDYLARNNPEAYRGIDVDWEELSKAEVVVAPDLGLETILPDGQRVEAETNAHMSKHPLTLYLRDANFLFDHDAGGRAVGQRFGSSQHRRMVMLAWSSSYIQNRKASSAMSLADDVPLEDDPLEDLERLVATNIGKRISAGNSVKSVSAEKTKRLASQPRRLKKLDSMRIEQARIVNGGAAKERRRRVKEAPPVPRTLDGPTVGTRATEGVAPTDYTADEREQLALQVLQGIVSDNKTKLKDFTRLRGLGADAGDELRGLFEIKAHGGEMPDSVSFELSQRRAANETPEKFYLAVVSGLEEGHETIVRLFARPMETLDLEEGTAIKLSGIRSSRAFEVRIGS